MNQDYLVLKDGVISCAFNSASHEVIESQDGTVLHPGQTAYISPEGAVILSDDLHATTPEGHSDVRSPQFSLGKIPDGKGGWILPPPPPVSDATSVRDWTLKAALAAKGLSFNPTDPTIAARWQYEPSFAIDGAVATAVKASLGYDDSQLQELFNEAAALK